jgi:hypothetical protein
MQVGFSMAKAENINSVYLPFLYNDEFRTNAAGEVLLADGTPLLVPVATGIPIAADGKTYDPGVVTQIMTVDILKNGDASGRYRASLDAGNGRITNADSIGLRVPGVGTGRTGLPISGHQLGFTPPGSDQVLVAQGGERAIGHPYHALTLTATYKVSGGFFKGLFYGANAVKNWDTVYYYYTDAADNNALKQYKIKNQLMVNAWGGYEFKFSKKVSWRIQLNIGNVFDERYMEIFPNASTGDPDNARLMRGPRVWILTNTLNF